MSVLQNFPPAPRVFTKLMKVPISLLLKVCIRRYAFDSSFSRETTNCLGYVDISVSDLETFNHHSKVNIGSDIDFGISMIISRFTEYDTKSTKTECGKDKHPMQKGSREVTRTVRELRKLIE